MAFYGFKVILTVLDDEERGTRRKERWGGRSDGEEGATRRKEWKEGRSNEEEGVKEPCLFVCNWIKWKDWEKKWKNTDASLNTRLLTTPYELYKAFWICWKEPDQPNISLKVMLSANCFPLIFARNKIQLNLKICYFHSCVPAGPPHLRYFVSEVGRAPRRNHFVSCLFSIHWINKLTKFKCGRTYSKYHSLRWLHDCIAV